MSPGRSVEQVGEAPSGGLTTTKYADFMAKKPEEVIRKAVRGMIPKNSLGRSMLTKLKVYAGPTHPHLAQGPVPYELTQVAQ